MKKKKEKSRSWVAQLMNETTCPKTFVDQKKESKKKACRKWRAKDCKNYPEGFDRETCLLILKFLSIEDQAIQ